MANCVPWEADTSCCDDWDDLDPILQDRSVVLAWDTIRALTAGRVGFCPATVRPCLSEPCNVCAGEWMRPMIRDGQWLNTICGTPECSCVRLCEIVFPGSIARIEEILLDGITLDPMLFRVDNGNRLVRQDGQCWPSCQRMDCALGEVCTLGITYTPGIVPDAGGLYAAGVLACEYSKACSGQKCRLPSSVTSIARQGVSFAMSTGMFPDGQTGIREVDGWLVSVNPHAIKLPAMVWSPDVPWAKHRWTTWTAPTPP
jgi:hypothetical protein